jgi:hypothetical protein
MSDVIKILCLVANPTDTGWLRLGEEMREISEKIDLAEARDRFELIQHHALRVGDLQRVLMKHQPHIVHFSGHGSKDEELILENAAGKSQQVRRQAVAELFRILKDNVRIIVFNACFTRAQAVALGDNIDYTVGTDKPLGDRAAVVFAAAFYLALAYRRSVRDAFESARLELSLQGLAGADAPELFVREGVDDAEPFLDQKAKVVGREMKAGDGDFVGRLRGSLARLAGGTFTEEDKQLVRQALDAELLTLEPIEGGPTRGADIEAGVEVTADGGAAHVELDASICQYIQEQLWPPPPGIPPPLPGLFFIGREESVERLRGMLSAPSGPADNLTVVRGWPGVGKTTLVNFIGRDPETVSTFYDGVLWTSLDQKPELISVLASWGRALGTDELLKATTLTEATDMLTGLLRPRRMLLIVDDVWDQAHAIPFIRAGAGSRCSLLITTRLTSVAEALPVDEARTYVVPVLTEENALLLLGKLAPGIARAHPDDCLPLALHVAGRMLKAEQKMGLKFVDLINGIRKGARLIPEPAPLDRAEGATTPTVAALLRRSTDQLDDETRECFAFLGAFASKPATFDLEAMQSVWEIDDPTPFVRKLVGHGLLEPVGSGRFRMHALLVQHARSLFK